MDFTLKSEIVVTGEIPGYKRSQIAEIISYSGGRLAPVVTYSTNYLVVGLKPGKTKLDKAIRIGTPRIEGRSLKILLDNAVKERRISDASEKITKKRQKPQLSAIQKRLLM